MHPRAQWLVTHVTGTTIANLGYAGDGPVADTLNTAIGQANPQATIIPIDINAQLVRNLATPNATIGSVLELPLKTSSVDAVIMGELLEHFYDIYPILIEASRVVKPGGHLYITTPNPYQIFRFLKHWLLKPNSSLASKSNYRQFLGDADHKNYWEPLSLTNTLAHLNFQTVSLETISIRIHLSNQQKKLVGT